MVYAAGEGVVTRAGFRGSGSGLGVQISVSNGTDVGTMEYFHMGSVLVREGEWVAAGGVLGTGTSGGPGTGIPGNTGAHLDFKITVNGRFIDPVSVTPALQGKGLEGVACATNPRCK